MGITLNIISNNLQFVMQDLDVIWSGMMYFTLDHRNTLLLLSPGKTYGVKGKEKKAFMHGEGVFEFIDGIGYLKCPEIFESTPTISSVLEQNYVKMTKETWLDRE